MKKFHRVPTTTTVCNPTPLLKGVGSQKVNIGLTIPLTLAIKVNI